MGRGPYWYTVKSCGKQHTWCRECQPKAAAALAAGAAGGGAAKGAAVIRGRRKTLDSVLVLGSTEQNWYVKKRAFEAGLLENKCAGCGTGPEWHGNPLTLELDHINGEWP